MHWNTRTHNQHLYMYSAFMHMNVHTLLYMYMYIHLNTWTFHKRAIPGDGKDCGTAVMWRGLVGIPFSPHSPRHDISPGDGRDFTGLPNTIPGTQGMT